MAEPAPWIDYDRHARTRPRDDLWGQVRRTVRGQPVAPGQIDLIVDTIQTKLGLCPRDTLLDLACGNGALTSRLHPHVAASVGVDISDYLIGIAQERFATPAHAFIAADASHHTQTAPSPKRFTKALCYGSLSYMDDAAVGRLLQALHRRFTAVTHLFLGNLPDPTRARAFYTEHPLPDLTEPKSDIGTWRSPEHIAALAGPAWTISTSTMPKGFFSAHYRFDALLERAS